MAKKSTKKYTEDSIEELKRQITESLSGIDKMAGGLQGFNDALNTASRLMITLASSGKLMVSSITKTVAAVREMTEAGRNSSSQVTDVLKNATGQATQAVGKAQEVAEKSKAVADSAQDMAKNIGNTMADTAAGAGQAAAAAGGGGGSGASIFSGVMSGLGAAASLASGIFGIFKRRREEEKRYRREQQEALNKQMTAEIQLALLTSQRLIDEQAITREKYKQIEAGLKKTEANRNNVITDIYGDLTEYQRRLMGSGSSRYKREANNYYQALLALKNHSDDLDWLETVGGSPLINKSAEEYDKYQALYERLLEIARQEEEWKDQQRELADDLIGSSSQTLADLWVEAFKKGEEATWDFAKNFEDVMRQAIINGFSGTLIMEQMEPIFEKFREKVMAYLSGEIELDEVVTPDLEKEIAETSEKIKNLSPELRKILESLGLEVENSGSETLSAAIKGVSEQTASLVAGQMNAIRTNQIKSMDLFSESLATLGSIESNTRYNRYLESIDRRLAAMSSSTSLRASGLA